MLGRSLTLAAGVGLALIAAAPAGAQALGVPSGTYNLDRSHASITWRVNHLGLSMYTARFATFDSRVTLDANDPTRSSLTVTIDPKSVRTDFPFRDREDFDGKIATDARFLDANKFPEIRFVSRSITRTGANSGRIVGDLTMRGVTRPVTLDATLNAAKPHPMSKVPSLGISARGTLKRSEWGMTFPPAMAVGDDVELIIEAEYNQAKG